MNLYRKIKKVTRDKVKLGYIPNITHPKTFNEKIRNRMKNNPNPKFTQCSDKIGVRQYVIDKGLENILIPLKKQWNNSSGFSIENIETPCVLKANHNSGPVYVIKDKNQLSSDKIQDLKHQLTLDYGQKTGEKWYSSIVPSLFSEELLTTPDGDIPEDYKFHVFNSTTETKIIVQVDFDRFDNHSRCIYDEELNLLPFGILYPSAKKVINKPKNYDQMLATVKKLASEFNYVRVDLYNVAGEIFFGELTFAHGAGLEPFFPNKFDRIVGDFWETDSEGNY